MYSSGARPCFSASLLILSAILSGIVSGIAYRNYTVSDDIRLLGSCEVEHMIVVPRALMLN
jgi:hypothetical protein